MRQNCNFLVIFFFFWFCDNKYKNIPLTVPDFEYGVYHEQYEKHIVQIILHNQNLIFLLTVGEM